MTNHTLSLKIPFFLLLTFLIWLPLPWGSHSLWAETLLLNTVLLLLSFYLYHHWQHQPKLNKPFKRAWPLLTLLTLWWLYLGLQLLPLPSTLLEYLSPHALNWQQQLDPNQTTAHISLDWPETLQHWLLSTAFIGLFCLTLLLVQDKKQLTWLAYAFIISGVIQAVYGSIMTLSGTEWGFLYEKKAYQGVATGTFVNRNHLAGYLVMCLSVGIGLLLALLEDQHWNNWRQFWRHITQWLLSKKMLLRLALVLMVIALVLTHSRMGNTSFFAALLISSLLGMFFFRRAPRATLVFLISLAIIDIVIVGTWFGLEKVAERLEHTSMASEIRDEVSQETLVYWQDYFWLGSGLGSYYNIFRQYQSAETGRAYFDHAHNDYLQFAAETGIIGSALLAAIVLLSFLTTIKALYSRHTPLLRGLAFAVMMAIIALSIHSSVDFNLQIPANAASFMIILAMGQLVAHWPRSRTRRQTEKPLSKAQKGLLLVLLLGFVTAGVIANRVAIANFYAKESAFYLDQLNHNNTETAYNSWQLAQTQANKALAWNVNDANALHRMGIVHAVFAERFANTAQQRQATWQQAISYYQSALQLQPAASAIWANLALAYTQAALLKDAWQQAVNNAFISAPWQHYTLQVVTQIGMQHWFRLSETNQQNVLTSLEHRLLLEQQTKQRKSVTAQLLHNSRYRLAICRHTPLPETVQQACQNDGIVIPK